MKSGDSSSTIFALSSGAGRAGVAVIRVSGPAAVTVLDLMAPPRPKPRFAAFRKIIHPLTGEPIDEALVLMFAAPRTETGEDMAELHVHGGRAVVEATLAALAVVPGCRLAEAGEFARRSFDNGKIDLTAAEGLADLVDAETEAQRRQALAQAGGALAKLYDGWRTEIIAAQALAEAAIDFADEGDVGHRVFAHAWSEVASLKNSIERHLDDGRRGEILRDGYQVVLAGPPNAGKSSLLNALARRDAAIVSPEAGTTRDVIEVRLDLGGVPVVVADTAGLHEATAAVEREGIRRTRARARAADLVVWLIDGAQADPVPPPPDLVTAGTDLIVVRSKADLAGGNDGADLALSATTGAGIDDLAAAIARRAKARTAAREAPALTRTRHRLQLAACCEALERFLTGDQANPELRAEDLRQAASAVGRITGRVDVEDVLDQVFGRFCIGK